MDNPSKIKDFILSNEQEEAIRVFNDKKNMMLTGPGGSGKTALIKKMVKICKDEKREVQVCALTGCAAVLLECHAKTIHSWSGIGLANGPSDLIVKRVVTNKKKSSNWKKVDTLIIDEVSMMSQKVFEILDSIGRQVNKGRSHLPFGGIHIIFSGDFYQLPPVSQSNWLESDDYDASSSAFCFESPSWESTFSTVIQLKKIFRQTDEEYTNILNKIRVGKLNKSSFDVLCKHVNKSLPETFIPTILLPRRRDVELINMSELLKLNGEERKYKLERIKTLPTEVISIMQSEYLSEEQRENEYNYMEGNIMAEKTIVLKIGTQVMCVANIDTESEMPLVNGSQGVIVKFVGDLPCVRFNNGYTRIIPYHTWTSEKNNSIGIKQIPLIYAWAITIHKSQGVSLDMAQIDAGNNIFECGQTYVALSRIKSLSGLYLTAFDPQKIKVNKKVQEFYSKL